jgi:FPC/CPF motif-containing protein YcgG
MQKHITDAKCEKYIFRDFDKKRGAQCPFTTNYEIKNKIRTEGT